MLKPFTAVIRHAWSIDRPLTVSTVLMLGAFIGAVTGLWLDPRIITGAPAWLKPAKFGISTAIYGATLLWLFTSLPEWTRTRRVVGWTTAIVFIVEVAIIDLQAWRGTTSHFNTSTPLNALLFSLMGIGIGLQTVTATLVAVALWRQRFADSAFGWALRLGMTISVIGASTGGLMTTPTAAQMAQMRSAHTMPVAGAHTVGGPDGGPGMPATGWSRDHGDLRVPHFVGLHAIQALPLALLALPRRRSGLARSRLMIVLAVSYFGLFLLLLSQALRGEPLLQPSPLTLAIFTGLVVCSAVASFAAVRERAPLMQTGMLHAAEGPR